MGDNVVRIWDLSADTAKVSIIEGHMRSVKSLAFSADGRVLATGNGTGIIRLIEVETGKIRQKLEAHDCSINALYFDLEGNLVSGGCGGIVRVWDSSSGEMLDELQRADKMIIRLEGGLDSGQILVGFANGNVWLWQRSENVPSIQILGGGGEIKTVLSKPNDIRTLMDLSGGMSRIWGVGR